MLDCAVMGAIFEPPASNEILQAIEQTYNGHGTLLIIKNFEKDLVRFLDAEKQAQAKGLLVSHVIVDDDCSIESGTFEKDAAALRALFLCIKFLALPLLLEHP